MPKILVDADACPVKEEIYKVAFRRQVAVAVVSNMRLRVPDHPLIERVTVSDGFDAADDWIAEAAGPQTVVITADILLADRCLKAGAQVLAHAGKSGRRVVSAFIGTAFAQETADAASQQWRAVADQIRPKLPKLATLMDDAEPDVLAYMTFPKEHRAKLHSTNPIERLNGEIKRRTDVVGIFPNEAAITRLVGAILMEQSDEWAVQRARYMTLETMTPLSDNPIDMLSAVPGT